MNAPTTPLPSGPGPVDSVIELIGNTPLHRLRSVESELRDGVRVYAKLEFCNPGGSVKDRTARQIVTDALERGDLGGGTTLIDATSGNTGVAYAMLGSALGFPVTLVMPSNVSKARKQIVEAYGAEIVYSDPMEGSDGAIRMVREIVASAEDGRYWYADQYSNPSNPRAHELTTAPELWRDTDGAITHFVAGLGTSGTIVGTSRALKRFNPEIEIVAVEPAGAFHGLEGLKHMASSIVPNIYDESAHDMKIGMETEEGWDAAERLARDEGLLVGHSSGAAFAAALRVARGLDEGLVVALFPDHADRYIESPKREKP